MQLTIRVQNLAQFRAKMRKYPILIGRGLQEAIAKSSFAAERGIKKAVVSGATRAFDTGNLFRSIRTTIRPLEGRIEATAPYSSFVHKGTRYMRARPFMTVGLESSKGDIEGIMSSFIKRVLRSS